MFYIVERKVYIPLCSDIGMGRVSKRQIYEEWVEFHLNPDNYSEREIDSLNGKLARFFGEDRKAQKGFLERVDEEVYNRKRSSQRVGYDTAWVEAHKENEEFDAKRDNLREGDIFKRRVIKNIRLYSQHCKRLGQVPEEGVERKIYDLGVFLIEQGSKQ